MNYIDGATMVVTVKARYARNPRKLNHKGTKDTKEETQRQEEDLLFSPAGWTPGKKASTPGGVRPIPEGIAISYLRVLCLPREIPKDSEAHFTWGAFVVQKILSFMTGFKV